MFKRKQLRNFLTPRLYKKVPILLILISALLVYFSSILISPSKLTNRNNDLLEFKESFEFFKRSVLENHRIPTWQNRTLSGSPYLGDPQNPVLYVPNYFAILMPLDLYFIVSFIGHLFISLIGSYLLFRTLKISQLPSASAAIVYALSPKMSAHLEAGHLNLVAAYAWVPFIYYSLLQIKQRNNQLPALILGYSLAAIFLNYISIFAFVAVTVAILMVFNFKLLKTRFLSLSVALVVFLVITLPQLIASTVYLPLTTRSLITIDDIDKVISFRHYVHTIVSPYTYGLEKLNTEKVLTFGVLPLLLATSGFLIVPLKKKVIYFFITIVVVVISLGTKTFLVTYLLEGFSSLLIFRIPTRIWFIAILLVAFLSALALNKLKRKPLLIVIILLAILVEQSVFNYMYFISHQRLLKQSDFSDEITSLVSKDPGYYRVYCTATCPVKSLLRKGKGFASGYNPINLKNYFELSKKAGGYQFGLYTLSIPPFQSYVDQPQPVSVEMGKLGVRYIVSPYTLTGDGFEEVIFTDGLYIFKNKKELPRAYLKSNGEIIPVTINNDSPGDISLMLPGKSGKLVINEPFFPFWEIEASNKTKDLINYNGLISTDVIESDLQASITFNPPFSKAVIPLSLLTSVFVLASIITTAKKYYAK